MIKANEARNLIARSDLTVVQTLTEEMTKRIENLIQLTCQRGMSKVEYSAKYTLAEVKNELTRNDACANLTLELVRAGYEVTNYGSEFTISW